MALKSYGKRPWTFYVLATLFTAFVIFLYAPMIVVYILSFQGPTGGLVFPLQGVSLTWFAALFGQARTGDVGGAFSRSLPLAIIVLVLTVLISVTAGFAFRRRFLGAGFAFYVAVASLIVPGLVLSIGILVTLKFLGLPARWYTSGLGAHLSWTLPFGLLIMFAVLGRFDRAYEEAAYDLGANPLSTFRRVTLPLIMPGVLAGALMALALSIDDFVTSNFVSGSSVPFPVWVYGASRVGTPPQVFVFGTVIFMVGIAFALLSLGISRKKS